MILKSDRKDIYMHAYIPTYLPTYLHTHIHTYIQLYDKFWIKAFLEFIDKSVALQLISPAAVLTKASDKLVFRGVFNVISWKLIGQFKAICWIQDSKSVINDWLVFFSVSVQRGVAYSVSLVPIISILRYNLELHQWFRSKSKFPAVSHD